jgi:NitT/TauT family transport system permease protein
MRQKLLLTMAGVAVALSFWAAASMSGIVSKLLLPTPVEVFSTFVSLFSEGKMLPDVAATLYRTIVGFLLGAGVGIPVGLLMGYYRRVYDALEFLVDFFRSIPATALFPLFLLFFGIGDESKIFAVVFATSFIVTINTMYGVRHRSRIRTNFARTLKMGSFDLFKKVILPDAAPHIFAGLRIAISISLIVVIVTEMFIGTSVGLGRRIMDSQLVYDIPEMYASIIMAGIVGYLINRSVMLLEKKKVHWGGR